MRILFKGEIEMIKTNRELLEEVIKDRLTKALGAESSEQTDRYFEEAMKAIDRQIKLDEKELEIEKVRMNQNFEVERDERRNQYDIEKDHRNTQFEFERQEMKQQHELDKEELIHKLSREESKESRDFEMKKKKLDISQANKDRMVRVIEIGAAVVAAPLIEAGCKKAFAKMICTFEQDNIFTTTAGRSLSGLFKFKK